MRTNGLVLALAVAASLVVGTAMAAAQGPSGTPTPAASPTSSPTPAPAGTPWPAPANIALDTTVTITRPDGSFIPIEERVATSIVSWQQLPGYTGVFEVERALTPYNSGQPRAYVRIATVPAAPEPAMVGYPDTHPFREDLTLQRCYRVRAVINGETGPYSAEVCSPVPPTTGPAPGAPNTGSGLEASPSRPGSLAWMATLALAGLAVSSAGLGVHRWRKRGPGRRR